MRRLLLVAALATACAPAATAPTASRASAISSPNIVSSSVPPAAAPTIAPAPATPPTVAPAPGPIHNEGQLILVDLPRGYSTFVGEGTAAPIVTDGTRWKLNGTVLTGADVRCTQRPAVAGQGDLCLAVRILTDRVRLRNGASYELVLDSELIGMFVASGLAAATPHVLSLKATQYELTVQFDRPMLHVGECGAALGSALTTPGTLEHVRGTGTFPAPLGAYTSSSAAYSVFLSALVSEAHVSADCTSVKFGSGWGGPTGTFDVSVAGVRDVDGNVVQPRTFTVAVQDEGPPKLMFAQLELQTATKKVVRVAYSEAMDEEYVTDVERYYLNGRPLPAGTTIECELAGCTWVRLVFAPTAFSYGADNVLSIVEVRDLAGNATAPAILTSAPFSVR